MAGRDRRGRTCGRRATPAFRGRLRAAWYWHTHGEKLRATARIIKALAATINQLIVEFNINVEQYNREGSALGVYEEGVYVLNGTERAIEIYKFHDRPQVVRLHFPAQARQVALSGPAVVPPGSSIISPIPQRSAEVSCVF